MNSKWETRANIAFIIACAIVSAVAVLTYIRFSRASPETPTIREYAVGDSVELAGLKSTTDRTLLLYVRSSCEFCTASMPFYKRLGDAPDRRYRLVAVSIEPIDRTRAYFEENGVKIDETIRISPGALRMRATPTLIAMDSQLRVLGSWRGKLDEDRESQVRDRLVN